MREEVFCFSLESNPNVCCLFELGNEHIEMRNEWTEIRTFDLPDFFTFNNNFHLSSPPPPLLSRVVMSCNLMTNANALAKAEMEINMKKKMFFNIEKKETHKWNCWIYVERAFVSNQL